MGLGSYFSQGRVVGTAEKATVIGSAEEVQGSSALAVLEAFPVGLGLLGLDTALILQRFGEAPARTLCYPTAC